MADAAFPPDLIAAHERRGAVEQTLSHLESMLDLRTVRPGERLPSAAELAKAIGVSRPAVLSALKILASQGRVVVKPGRGGNWVTEHQPDNLDARIARAWEQRDRIIQMAHLREILEPGSARLAVTRQCMTPEQLADARRMAAEMRRLTWDDVESYRALDTELHLLIAHATGMPVVESFVAMCRREVAAAFDVMDVPPSRKKSSDDEHDALLDAIEAGDADAAAAVAHRHIQTTTVLLERVLANGRGPARHGNGAVGPRQNTTTRKTVR